MHVPILPIALSVQCCFVRQITMFDKCLKVRLCEMGQLERNGLICQLLGWEHAESNCSRGNFDEQGHHRPC